MNSGGAAPADLPLTELWEISGETCILAVARAHRGRTAPLSVPAYAKVTGCQRGQLPQPWAIGRSTRDVWR